MTDLQPHFEEIMNNFNFRRCVRVMKHIDWRHQNHRVKKKDLKALAQHLLEHVIHRGGAISSGGLKAERIDDQWGSYLTLTFYLDQWDTADLELMMYD